MAKDLAEGIKHVAQALNKYEVEYMFVGGVAISSMEGQDHRCTFQRTLNTTLTYGIQQPMIISSSLLMRYLKISPELKNDLDKIVFDPKKTFIKFNLDKFHFDFLPELVAFYHKDFKRCYANKEVGEIESVKINIISKNDLLRDKEKLSRDKDLADIENLKKNSYKGFAR